MVKPLNGFVHLTTAFFVANSSPQSGPSEDTPSNSATSFIHPLREPEPLRLLILDAPLAPSTYGPIQRPATMSEVCKFLAHGFFLLLWMHDALLFPWLISP